MIQVPPNSPAHRYVGIGFKSIYLGDVMAENTDIGWLEVHAENYMIDGGPRKAMMRELASRYPISCHGVGLSIGAETGIDPEHLERLKTLMDWLQPQVFSEHLAWSSHNAGFFNDLLPLPYTRDVLNRVATHIDHVQETLGRRMLLENPSTYLAFDTSDMSEVGFITELADRTGCGLLLDINNVFVSAQNQKQNAYDYIDAFPLQHVGEFHLGGHAEDTDDAGEPLLIDSHNNPVVDPVWALYEYTIARVQTQPIPTLIEWDSDLPTWEVLRGEAHRASDLIATEIAKEAAHAS